MTLVPPSGPTDSPLVALVGEAPGAEEERLGRPFVGASGQLLDRMLDSSGLIRNSCYITNVAKTRPPNNDFRSRYYQGKSPTPELLSLHSTLNDELRAVKPGIVVALGAEALYALTNHHNISDYRGTLVEHQGLRILPTYHPSYILRGMYHERPVVECDLRKAYRQARFPYKPFTDFNIRPTFAETMAFLSRRPSRLAVDIETTNNIVRCVGFAWDRHHAISIPLMWGRTHAWTADEEAAILKAMSDLLGDPKVQKVIQNEMYDVTILARELGIAVRGIVMDTMLAQHLLYPELPKDLGFLSSIHTDHPMYWGYNSKSAESTAFYNCMDCVVTFEVAEKLWDELKERNLTRFYTSVVQRTVDSLLYVQSRGVMIDVAARQQLRVQVVNEMEETLARLRSNTSPEFNPWSHPQVKTLLYSTWKLPVQRNPKTKNPTVDDDSLKILAKNHPARASVLMDILACRQKRTLISTYIDAKLRDGRAVTSYNVGGAVTARLASSTTYDDYGGNLQNIPRGKFRRQYVADDGKVLIKSDLSQAEYRVLIWAAKVDRVIQKLLHDPTFSIHMWNASENVFRVPISEVTPQMYQDSKNGVYGANYNIGAMKVSRMYTMEFQRAKKIIENYHQAVPEVRGVYQRDIQLALATTRLLTNPLGRERLFMGRLDDETYRAAYSWYCQSTVADIINLGLCDLLDRSWDRQELGLEILLQVHDELVCQCWKDRAEESVALVRECMERPILVRDNPIPLTIPAEIKLGPNWYDTMSFDKWSKEHH